MSIRSKQENLFMIYIHSHKISKEEGKKKRDISCSKGGLRKIHKSKYHTIVSISPSGKKIYQLEVHRPLSLFMFTWKQ